MTPPRLPVLAAVLVCLVAGCAGARPVEASVGADEKSATVQALSLAVVTNEDGIATLSGTLLNTGSRPDRLVGVEAETERGPAHARLRHGSVPLPSSEPVRLARQDAVRLESEHLVPGFLIELTLTFERSAPVRMDVPVESPTGPYAEVEITRAPDGDISPG